MTTSTQPAVELLELEAETQELLPDHTYKAVMLRAGKRGSDEEKCELLRDVVKGFKRGMA